MNLRLGRGKALTFAALAWAAGAPALAGPTIPELVEVGDMTSLSASAGGRMVVFRLERASIADNRYLIEWYVADLQTQTVRRIAGGGNAIEGASEPLAVETAAWSPDGRFIFHRALREGAIGIWRTAIDGTGTWPVVVADGDVESMTVGASGRTLTYDLGPSRQDIERAERREYDEGILVDGSVELAQNLFRGGWVNGRLASQRMVGQWYTRAGLLWQSPRQRYSLDLETLETRPAEAIAPLARPPLTPLSGVSMVLETAGRPIARVRQEGDRSILEIERPEGIVACIRTGCPSGGIASLAWRPGADELAVTVQDSHYRQSLLLWDTVRGTVRTVVRTEGLIGGSRDAGRPCALTPDAAVCVTAGAVEPPRLERIDLSSGQRSVLFDPNALLRGRGPARVEQLTWTLADGRQVSGTVLRPPTAKGPAAAFISYYYCPGFLRGGVGDEFPFAPLVDAGFVVACLNRVPGSGNDILASYNDALASVRGVVDLLAQRGWIDRGRVGMGGFSAGSEATLWVAMNSDILSAAATASPQYSPSSYWSNVVPGRDYAEVLRAFLGLGSPDETPERWRLISPALNTERIRAPLLMQMPEQEARNSAELYTRLAASPTPVELYAFPDEGHAKVQPRHRHAAYRRSLDWFRYWLQGYTDPDRAKADQYRRWDAARDRRDAAQPSNDRNQVSADASSSKRM